MCENYFLSLRGLPFLFFLISCLFLFSLSLYFFLLPFPQNLATFGVTASCLSCVGHGRALIVNAFRAQETNVSSAAWT